MIETDVNATIRIEGAKRGLILWRNNSGAFENKAGRWVRYGLANDSQRVNNLLKSSDLIFERFYLLSGSFSLERESRYRGLSRL